MKTDDNQSPKIIVPLGRALKDARLVASLSIDEVAEKLNLGPRMVNELEDDLDNILATKKYPVIYLRGYLANYAKLVGLTTLELFVEYQQLECAQKQKKTLPKSNLVMPETKKRSKFLPLSLIIIIVLAALIYLFQKQFINAVEQVELFADPIVESSETMAQPTIKLVKNEQISITETPAAQVVEPEKQVIQTNIEKALTIIVAEDTPADDVVETVIELNDEVSEDIVISDVNKQQPAVSVEAIQSTEESIIEEVVEEKVEEVVEVVEDSVEESVTKIVEEEVDSKSNLESLNLTFNAECWTEVFDATGERIAFGLYQDGRVLRLSGVAPFQLKLGDPSVVEIQYQDQFVDGEFTPGRTANFSVPLS